MLRAWLWRDGGICKYLYLSFGNVSVHISNRFHLPYRQIKYARQQLFRFQFQFQFYLICVSCDSSRFFPPSSTMIMCWVCGTLCCNCSLLFHQFRGCFLFVVQWACVDLVCWYYAYVPSTMWKGKFMGPWSCNEFVEAKYLRVFSQVNMNVSVCTCVQERIWNEIIPKKIYTLVLWTQHMLPYQKLIAKYSHKKCNTINTSRLGSRANMHINLISKL